MTTLCITGAAQSDLALVADILHQAGVQAAKPASRGEAVDMAYWHGRVVPEQANGKDSPQPIAEVGKLWEQLASDIFLSNMESELWGWADARSTWLLDYWLRFEPGIKVLLVCVSRQQMLASAMANGSDRVSVDDKLHAWNAHHQELLRFNRQNPQRSLLVDAHDCAANPGALIEQCAGRWKLPLERSAEVTPARGAQDPLALYLAQQLCQEHPHSAGLQTELAGAITRMGGLEVRGKASTLGKWSERLAQVGKPKKVLSLYAPQAEEIVADFRLMRDKALRLQRVDEAREELEARNANLADEMARQAEKQAESEAWLAAAAKENALLLQRLREAQEKCDAALAEHGAAQQKASALQGELATASKARDEQAKLAAEGKARSEALTKERDGHAKQSTDRQAQIDALTKARDEQTKLATEAKTRVEALTKERDSQAKQSTDRQTQIDALTKSNSELTKARDDQAKLVAESKTRIEALTKERDSQAKQSTERQAQVDALTKSNAELTKARDDQAKLVAESKTRIEALTKSNAELTKARDEQAKLAAESKTRAEALTKERDSHAKQAADRQLQIDNLTKTNATFGKAVEEQTKLAAERQAKIDQLVKNPLENKAQADALKAAQDKLKESEQEGELLLLQLHQVQEELEHYFLQHQDLQAKQELAEARWKRMLARSPEYCDYESLEILPAESANDGATGWRVKGLEAAGRTLAELEFKTVIEHGIAGLVFAREPGKTGPFTRWPGNAADKNEVTLIPVGTNTSAPQRFETLFDLATCDWALLQTLARVLVRELDTPAALKPPAGFKPEALRNGLLELIRIIEQFPPTLRYDRVSLKREQVNKDYEHLQLRLENLAFGGKRWPEFEFRLACANIRPKRFGTHPKLEFPEETSQAPFQAWFIESYDDFGAKLELRFALPNAIDMETWQRVADNDRVFLKALINRLPAVVGTLRNEGVQIKRPWEDWDKLTRDMRHVIEVLAARSPASPPVAADRPAAAADAGPVPKKNAPRPMELAPLRKAAKNLSPTKAKGAKASSTRAMPAKARPRKAK